MTPSGRTVRRQRVRRRLLIGACVALVVVALWMARSTVHDAGTALAAADVSWIAVALGAELVAYAALGLLLSRLLARDSEAGWWTGVRLALVVFGLGGIMPASPAEGVTVATLELHRRGVEPGRGAGILVLSEWVRFLILGVLFAVDLTAAALNGRPLQLGLVSVIAASILILALVMVAARVARTRRAARAVSFVVDRIAHHHRSIDPARSAEDLQTTMTSVLGSRANRMAIAASAALGWVAEAGCLALCVRAVGGDLGLDAVLLAYVIASTVSLLPLLPGGLGAVEVAVPAVLHHFGVPLDAALAATFAWRGLSLLAPAVGGSVALVSLRRQSVAISEGGPCARRVERRRRRLRSAGSCPSSTAGSTRSS